MSTRRSNDMTMKEAIEHMLKAYRLKNKVNETRIIEHWEEIVGTTIGKYTDDVYIRNKTLIIKLRAPSLRTELMYQRERLAQLVNEHLGEEVIDEVVIR